MARRCFSIAHRVQLDRFLPPTICVYLYVISVTIILSDVEICPWDARAKRIAIAKSAWRKANSQVPWLQKEEEDDELDGCPGCGNDKTRSRDTEPIWPEKDTSESNMKPSLRAEEPPGTTPPLRDNYARDATASRQRDLSIYLKP